MSWLTGALQDGGWLTGNLQYSGSNTTINILAPDAVVDTQGTPVTHIYDYWFITQDDIDVFNYNGQAISVVENGTNLSVTGGETSLILNSATVGQTYLLVAFDSDKSNYFRFQGVAQGAV